MADSALNRYVMQGTSTQRASYTPSPATVASGQPLGVFWFETNTSELWCWNDGTSAWVQITGSGGLPSIGSLDTLINNTSGSAAPAAGSVTALIDMLTGTAATPAAQGSVLYRGASAWSILGPGTSGNVLQTNGGSANPTWVTPSGGGGGGAVTLIGTVTTTSSAANITFSSIPNTFNHLELVVKGVALAGGPGHENLFMDFNGDGGANYDWAYNTMGGSGIFGSQNFGYIGEIATIGTPPTVNSTSFKVLIPDYLDTTFNKDWLGQGAGSYATTNGNQVWGIWGGQWNNTAAITSIKVHMGSHDFMDGSKAWLYGIT